MGFALWADEDRMWAQGTHEYKPMGVAVIATTDLFRQSDFHSGRRCPSRLDRSFIGLFASLGDINACLRKNRSQLSQKNLQQRKQPVLPYI
jgi:hypothetical protein